MENLEKEHCEVSSKLNFFGDHIQNNIRDKKAFWLVDLPLIALSIFSVCYLSSPPADDFYSESAYYNQNVNYFSSANEIAPVMLNIKIKSLTALDRIDNNEKLMNADLMYIINELSVTKSALSKITADNHLVPTDTQINIKNMNKNIDGLNSLSKLISKENLMEEASKVDIDLTKTYIKNILKDIKIYEKQQVFSPRVSTI